MNEDKLDLATCTDLDELTRECRRLSALKANSAGMSAV